MTLHEFIIQKAEEAKANHEFLKTQGSSFTNITKMAENNGKLTILGEIMQFVRNNNNMGVR